MQYISIVSRVLVNCLIWKSLPLDNQSETESTDFLHIMIHIITTRRYLVAAGRVGYCPRALWIDFRCWGKCANHHHHQSSSSSLLLLLLLLKRPLVHWVQIRSVSVFIAVSFCVILISHHSPCLLVGNSRHLLYRAGRSPHISRRGRMRKILTVKGDPKAKTRVGMETLKKKKKKEREKKVQMLSLSAGLL